LVDSGPLVALLSERDQHHDVCFAAAGGLRGTFHTSWAVITEAAHLLKRDPESVQKLLAWIRTSELLIQPLTVDDVLGIAGILDKYRDQTFDFADATLMYADREQVHTVFTIDQRHFAIYRTKSRRQLELVPAAS
jgi:predicted nucleic acid-binding protein